MEKLKLLEIFVFIFILYTNTFESKKLEIRIKLSKRDPFTGNSEYQLISQLFESFRGSIF